VSLTGDFAQLDRMAAALGELARVPSRTARAVSDRLEGLIQEEFDAGHDPDEEPWAPLSPVTEARGRSMPPGLDDSGTMRGSVVVRPLAGAGVGITVDHPAGVHQTGWEGKSGTGPARPVLPARGELPERWVEVVEAEAEKAFRGVMRK
jgi:hypothetical protein